MPDILQALRDGTVSLWIFIPAAILLGALHGLEPGHSKTMMAAFIIAIRGTMWQAVLLGLSAAISHSLLIWLLAALALHYGSHWSAERVEPWLQLISGLIIAGIAIWMFVRTRREVAEAAMHEDDHHRHDHEHEDHTHATGPLLVPEGEALFTLERKQSDRPLVLSSAPAPAHTPSAGLILPQGYSPQSPTGAAASTRPSPKNRLGKHGGIMINTGHGWLEIELHSEQDAPARFRVHPCKSTGEPLPLPRGTMVTIDTARLDGSTQQFQFDPRASYWESTAVLPQPHEFQATVTMAHGDHAHTYRLQFASAPRQNGHVAIAEEIKEAGDDVYQDAHERAHAEDIARRFANRAVTTPQIVLFGITGGLMPCPAAFTILLVCLQLKRVALGFTIVGAFSFGLALTMVAVGALAALSVKHAEKRFRGFGEAMRRAPYISCAVLLLLAVYMTWQGWSALEHGTHVH